MWEIRSVTCILDWKCMLASEWLTRMECYSYLRMRYTVRHAEAERREEKKPAMRRPSWIKGQGSNFQRPSHKYIQ